MISGPATRPALLFTRMLTGAVALALFFACPAGAWAGGVDNTIYAGLLEDHVIDKRVNYQGLKQDEALLDRYLAVLSTADPETLTRNHAFAFYINAYNAFTLKLILTKYPEINSIKEIGSFFSNPWSKKFIPLNGRTVTLDYIEHEVLRPRFNDPRVHFAINCAARSCPPLHNKPFEGEIIETQLDDLTRAFINDPGATFVREGKLHISKIFSWFSEDFSDNPLRFIRQYAGPDLLEKMDAAGPDLKISYLHYDWSLNRR